MRAKAAAPGNKKKKGKTRAQNSKAGPSQVSKLATRAWARIPARFRNTPSLVAACVAFGYLIFLILLWREPADAVNPKRPRGPLVLNTVSGPPPEPEPPSPAVNPAAGRVDDASGRSSSISEVRSSEAARLIWPTAGRAVTSPFGARVDPVSGIGVKRHRGVDVRSECGTPIVAAAAGKVIFANYTQGSGNVVKISHKGMTTRYAHLASLSVSEGQYVEAGEEIGLSGATGRTTGPHLHFEIWTAKGPRNPASFRYRHLPPHTFARTSSSCGQQMFANKVGVEELDFGGDLEALTGTAPAVLMPGDDALKSFLNEASTDLRF